MLANVTRCCPKFPFCAQPRDTAGCKLVLWWDANDRRLAAEGDSSAGPAEGGGRGSKAAPGTRNGGDHDRLSGGRVDFSARDHAPDVPVARWRERRDFLADRHLVWQWPGGDSRDLQG